VLFTFVNLSNEVLREIAEDTAEDTRAFGLRTKS